MRARGDAPGQAGTPRSPGSARRREKRIRGREGVALVIAMTAISILSVMLADMHANTSTAYVVSTSQRDRLQAEYMAKSGLTLTRLLIAREPELRLLVAPMLQMFTGKAPSQIPVWKFANPLLLPFCDLEGAKEAAGGAMSTESTKGLGKTPGTCEINAFSENSKVNVSDPLLLDGERASRSVAMQLFSLLGGYQNPSPYDPLFTGRDADGNLSTRLDIVSAMIDWWDIDTSRTVFDPTSRQVSSAGAETDIYSNFKDPYKAKNAPFDSIEEIRLVQGVGDDFWATFVEPDPEDPSSRTLTIYGSGAVDPNEAPPEVMLSRICSLLVDQSLCSDPIESSKFVQLMHTVRALAPVPCFSTPASFLDFLEGKGNEKELYSMLKKFLGPDNPLLFRPIVIRADLRPEVEGSFSTISRIISIQSEGRVGNSRVRLRAVVNFDERWTPPPPNAGSMPGLGVVQHYRAD